MKKYIWGAIFATVLLAAPAFAQTGGPVNVKATDTVTGASTEVGDATNKALRVNIVAGGTASAAVGATGAAVPASIDYMGLNVAGTSRGATGVNPSGSIYAQQMDLSSVAGTTVATGNGTASGSIRVSLPTDGTGVVGLIAGSALVGKVGVDQTTPGTTNAVALSHIGSTATATGNGVVSAGVQRVAIASDNTAFSVNAAQSGTWNIGTVTTVTGVTAVTAVTSITNAVITKPIDGCGTTNYDGQGLIADTTLDVVTATTTCVDSITVNNKGTASTTILLQDTSGTPLVFVPTTTIAPGGSLTVTALGGVKMTSGIKVQASVANNLTYFIKGRQ